MKTVCKLAWRNVWRHPRRSLLTMLAIAFASAVLVFFIGIQLSSYDASINATVSIYHGSLQVQPEGYLDKKQIRNTLNEPEELRRSVLGIEGVTAAGIRAEGFALASSEQRTYGVQVVGVEPNVEQQISTIPGVVRVGRYLESATAYEAVIGETLARNLKLSLGGELTLLGQGRDGSLAATVIPVVGIYASGSQEIDRGLIQMPLEAFREVFHMGGAAHMVVMKAERLDVIAELQQRIRASIPVTDGQEHPSVVHRWDEIVPGILQAIKLDMSSGWLFYFSLILIVTFSVVNTFLMSVIERTREFAILLALGTKPRLISFMVLLEALFLTLLGIGLGMLMGAGVVWYFGVHGFSVPGMDEVAKLWNMPDSIYPRLTFRTLTDGPLVIFLMAVLAAIVPAIRARQISPTDGLRQV